MIPEYRGNPLIEALPDIWSGGQVIQMLSEKAAYNNGERELDMQYRMHCIYRLFRYFQPLEQHIDIEQRISRSIRQGYLYRNPLTPEYAAGLADGYAAMKDKASYHVLHGVNDHWRVRSREKHGSRKNPFSVSAADRPYKIPGKAIGIYAASMAEAGLPA